MKILFAILILTVVLIAGCTQQNVSTNQTNQTLGPVVKTWKDAIRIGTTDGIWGTVNRQVGVGCYDTLQKPDYESEITMLVSHVIPSKKYIDCIEPNHIAWSKFMAKLKDGNFSQSTIDIMDGCNSKNIEIYQKSLKGIVTKDIPVGALKVVIPDSDDFYAVWISCDNGDSHNYFVVDTDTGKLAEDQMIKLT